MTRMRGAGFAQRSVTRLNEPTAFYPETYIEPVEGTDPEDVRLGGRAGRAAEPEGAWDQNQRDRGALPASNGGKVTRRAQSAASPQATAAIIASLTAKS